MDAKKPNAQLMTKLRELSEKPDGWGDIRVIEPADARNPRRPPFRYDASSAHADG